jgi:hypothetical protein
MELCIEQLDSLKEIVLQVANTAVPWHWALVAFTGYRMWKYYQQYVSTGALKSIIWLASYYLQIPIPTCGGILSFSRILSAIRMSLQGPEVFSQIYSKYPMILFPRIESWTVVVQPQFLDEVIKAPDDVVSFLDALGDVSSF